MCVGLSLEMYESVCVGVWVWSNSPLIYLEVERQELMNEAKKKDNKNVIQAKMDKTFSIRRLEVVTGSPAVTEFKERWPALFFEAEVSTGI